jgi:hypothetical protein
MRPKFEALGGAIWPASAAGAKLEKRTAVVTNSAAPRNFLPVHMIDSFHVRVR